MAFKIKVGYIMYLEKKKKLKKSWLINLLRKLYRLSKEHSEIREFFNQTMKKLRYALPAMEKIKKRDYMGFMEEKNLSNYIFVIEKQIQSIEKTINKFRKKRKAYPFTMKDFGGDIQGKLFLLSPEKTSSGVFLTDYLCYPGLQPTKPIDIMLKTQTEIVLKDMLENWGCYEA